MLVSVPLNLWAIFVRLLVTKGLLPRQAGVITHSYESKTLWAEKKTMTLCSVALDHGLHNHDSALIFFPRGKMCMQTKILRLCPDIIV